ncbi:MAG: DUF2784 domain-containing protein [Bacteroidales bacterium]|nr:MAG: DUF2784 domain-containing protein [Bacteroidales bacterium]
MFWYKLTDLFFLCFHSILVIFNLFGWIWKRTRRLNLITLSLTGGSWFILGIFYGLGYCPLTDWHFQALRQLGKTNLPNSYMKYIADRITGLDFNDRFVDTLTVILFFLALFISLVLNIRTSLAKRKNKDRK